MQRCMNISYAYYDTPSPDVGVIAGTLGVWTLFDYGGEPGPWPTVSSSFGQFDYAGFPKSAAYWCTSDFFLLPLEVATCLTRGFGLRPCALAGCGPGVRRGAPAAA